MLVERLTIERLLHLGQGVVRQSTVLLPLLEGKALPANEVAVRVD